MMTLKCDALLWSKTTQQYKSVKISVTWTSHNSKMPFRNENISDNFMQYITLKMA